MATRTRNPESSPQECRVKPRCSLPFPSPVSDNVSETIIGEPRLSMKIAFHAITRRSNNDRVRKVSEQGSRPTARSTTHRSTKTTMATLGDDMRVGIYVRRSTDDEHQPYSLEAQDTRLTAYIDSNPGWRLVARFSDDASGASTNRPGLHRALKAAHAGLIDVLLVYRVDRFTRNLRDMVVLLDELDQTGVVFRSATEPFDTATPMGRMLVQMLGMFAQFERDTIIDRVIAGMERKTAKGKWKGGKRPFGYQVDKTTHTL